jgi:hypothetical protein
LSATKSRSDNKCWDCNGNIFNLLKVFCTGISISYPHNDPNNPFLGFENSIAVVGIAQKYCL